ncbi:hypothetical protein, partial [Pseudomonas sp. SIMBA_021]|uniref:hypothetical protein n=1 Tax=Pseudomonas sp. SIMBA_021 TaxID=3085767 RepID=UPI00397B315E
MSATPDYLNLLQSTGDFLNISRDNESHLASSQLTLNNGTQVNVHDTGVIEFQPAVTTSKDIVLSSAV